MYSARVEGEPTTFGTSGLLYRSNKLMYDRATNSLWQQFTGEAAIGPMADDGAVLAFFPTVVTTWIEWITEHPDTTVLSIDTGVYPFDYYQPESHPRSFYYDYLNSTGTKYAVRDRSADLATKEVVLGVSQGGQHKAYPVVELQKERVVNDEVGGVTIVVVASSDSQAARAYERGGHHFTQAPDDTVANGTPGTLFDSTGARWLVTEEFLFADANPSKRLRRLPAFMTFWFGWYQSHPGTHVYGVGGGGR